MSYSIAAVAAAAAVSAVAAAACGSSDTAGQAVIRPDQTRDYLIRMLDVYKLRITRGVGQHLMRTWPTSY